MTSAESDELFSVRDRSVLVTGATSGLGRRMAEVLHARGARVAITGRRRERLDEVAKALPGTVAVPCDLEQPETLDRVVAEVSDRIGAIEVLVNNAGMGYGVPAHEETLEKMYALSRVNLISPYRLAQLVYPSMADRGGGSIVNVTSIAAHVGVGRIPQAFYAASKGGLLSLTRELASQWGREGIRVNALAPGFFRSEMTEGVFASEKLTDYVVRNSMLQRVGSPADLDGALLYLASDASAFMTGQTLLVDGGWTAR